jgi:hypothetical protein
MAELTRNASDVASVRYAERHNRRRERRTREDMRLALQHPPTRRLLWRILFEARCDIAHATEDHPEQSASVWRPGAEIHAATGRRDLGLLVMGWIQSADAGALIAMYQEQLAMMAADTREIEAAHTASASDTEHGQ